MAWTEDIYPHIQPYDPHAFQIVPAPQQPATILQQFPATVMPPGLAPSIRTGGHVKEDLVELMMIQNAQMHQVIMSNMTMSALRLFGYSSPVLGAEENNTMVGAPRNLVLIQENEADPEVYHHYYEPAPHLSYLPWVLPQATLVYQEEPNNPSSAPPHSDRPAVAPPPPLLSSSGTLGGDSAPAAENNNTAGPKKRRREKDD